MTTSSSLPHIVWNCFVSQYSCALVNSLLCFTHITEECWQPITLMKAGVINTSPGEPEPRLAGDFERHTGPKLSIRYQYQSPVYAVTIWYGHTALRRICGSGEQNVRRCKGDNLSPIRSDWDAQDHTDTSPVISTFNHFSTELCISLVTGC